jgi:hypothetical protein
VHTPFTTMLELTNIVRMSPTHVHFRCNREIQAYVDALSYDPGGFRYKNADINEFNWSPSSYNDSDSKKDGSNTTSNATSSSTTSSTTSDNISSNTFSVYPQWSLGLNSTTLPTPIATYPTHMNWYFWSFSWLWPIKLYYMERIIC